GNDHLVRLWSAADGSPVGTLAGHDCHVYNVAFHPGGTRLASADLKGVVKDWDVAKGVCVRDLDAKVLHKYDPGFMADIGGGGGVWFWKGDETTSSHTVVAPMNLRDFALSPSGERFAVAGGNGSAVVYTLLPKK